MVPEVGWRQVSKTRPVRWQTSSTGNNLVIRYVTAEPRRSKRWYDPYVRRFVLLPFLATLAFGQDTPRVSEESDRVIKIPNTARRGDRVFNWEGSSGTVTEARTMPSLRKRYEPRPGDRVFSFKDSRGTATEALSMPSLRRRYEPRRNDRVFYFKDNTETVPDKAERPGQGEAGKK